MKKFFVFLFVFTLAICGYAQVKELIIPLSKVEASGNTFTTSQNDLINYRRSLPGVEAQYLVRLNQDLLKRDVKSIKLTIPGQKELIINQINYRVNRPQMDNTQVYTWTGRYQIHDISMTRDATFYIFNDSISGIVSLDISGYEYDIKSVGDGVHSIIKINSKKANECCYGNDVEISPREKMSIDLPIPS